MPPKQTNGNGKRKASTTPETENKRAKKSVSHHPNADETEKYGIVDRNYYPAEMSNERCLEYINNERPRPIDVLNRSIKETETDRAGIKVKDAVVFWFKQDLRTRDNKGLHLASEKAKSKGVPLVCLYIVSPEDFEAHITSSVRVDFTLRTLRVLKDDLANLDIPLYVLTVEKRKEIPAQILQLCKDWGAGHLFANIEYEVDELRREAELVRKGLEEGIAVTVVPDTCVVAPGELRSGSGNQYAVFSPFNRSWISYLHSNPRHLDLFPQPTRNPATARDKHGDLFQSSIPDAPKSKSLTQEERKRHRSLWPAGEHEAHERLQKFLTQRIGKYKDKRNFPAEDATSMLSAHLAAGTLSGRSVVSAARDANSTKKLDGGNPGITGWISEVAWRDFYKHVLAHWPFVCMNKCFKPEYTNIAWEYNEDHFSAWKEGRTGYPIVDAAMRQLNHMGYMHNRCRMITASFLAKDLLLDWRMGEQYFMSKLIDGDFASNNGGWGFSASTGVDPQPYFRIFNPTLQSEKFDVDGTYIRKWVPELKDVKGKAIHEPWARGADAICKKAGYPRPTVEHKFARQRALDRYKKGLGRDTA
ncbi:hypothetical protein MMC10_003407 [Thelotrema lepadinum]|nr:hypothetical protein [Thelotrema lepadinum]